ncbi:recombinase family protein [Bifidobacterium pseudolongum]|uniref:DNA invertase-like protein n=3 Tax=Bifidobacterium pseudolongum subsp. globosum TaxID=1690 RepID=A0A2N3QRV0_9BIFI|nr:recombinase family protein [Bifidobacterium pseudolongum]PKU94617.1 DNA invertase-like protein [Bifidobacterium pseudolongum subsp. globosum]PKV02458.1 DNA invertase-like protein [Bifidobacterium pseudolongum subsp. globosum]RYQ73229.1 DNA invertase [Bifidobacterium pseudolongum subsp. globosum]RYQ74400.1 DNA invertase [Bifidobacterium pseudolongum subsp. globosum]
MESRTFGYARVSTTDQNPDSQIDMLTAAGCDRIFVDYASGAKEHRPQLDLMLEMLREGDQCVCVRLDRLGRSVQNLVALINRFNDMGVQFKSLTEQIDTTTPGGVLIFNVFGAMAQFERDLIRERTNAGLKAARARGRKGGRPARLTADQVKEVRRKYDGGTMTVKEIADLYDVGKTTVYRALEKTKVQGPGKEKDR